MVGTSASGKSFPGWSDIDENLIPKTDNTYDLGSNAKKWASLYVVLALVTSLTIGGVVKLSTVGTTLIINDSTEIQGDLTIEGFSNGSILFTNASGTIQESPNNLYWDEAGKSLAIASTETSMTLGGVTKTHVLTTHSQGGSNAYDVAFHRHSASTGTFLAGIRSRGSEASPTIVQDGDLLMDIKGIGYDGTDNEESSAIHFEVDGVPGTDDMPGRILFMTVPDNSSTETERMRIDRDGFVGINVTDPTHVLNVVGSSNFTANMTVEDCIIFSSGGAICSG